MPGMRVTDEQLRNGLLGSLPRDRTLDTVVSAAGAIALDALPLVGPALSTAFQSSIQAVSQREMNAWLARIAEVVDVIAHVLGVSADDVVGDGQFYQSLVRASRTAQESTEPLRLAQLESAVARSGSWSGRPPVLERTLMRLLIELELEQVELLRVVDDPRAFARTHPGLDGDFSLEDVSRHILHVSGPASSEIIGRHLNDLYLSGATRAGFGPGYQPLKEVDPSFELTELGRQLLLYAQPLRRPADTTAEG